MKRGLKLRRFRSEVNIEDKNDSTKAVTLSLEPRGGGEADATELLQGAGLSHAVSQPDMLGRIRQPSPRLRLRPNAGTMAPSMKVISSRAASIISLCLFFVFFFSPSRSDNRQWYERKIFWGRRKGSTSSRTSRSSHCPIVLPGKNSNVRPFITKILFYKAENV